LIANAIQWAGHGPQTGLVVFIEGLGTLTWAPAQWGLTLGGASGGDDVNIVEPFDPALPPPSHPIYDGSLGGPSSGAVNDGPFGAGSVNWGTSHHVVWASFDANVFTVSEFSTSPAPDQVVSLVREPAAAVPMPVTLIVLGVGAAALAALPRGRKKSAPASGGH
jgi:hypothetical protein